MLRSKRSHFIFFFDLSFPSASRRVANAAAMAFSWSFAVVAKPAFAAAAAVRKAATFFAAVSWTLSSVAVAAASCSCSFLVDLSENQLRHHQ